MRDLGVTRLCVNRTSQHIYAQVISGDISVAEGTKPELTITLKYYEGKPVIEKIVRISKPSLRVYKGASSIPTVEGGLGVAIVTTSHGVMTDRAARAAGIGGEVICTVF